jgi:NADH dehydrogenase (ubiquinone) Fe-S protein 6
MFALARSRLCLLAARSSRLTARANLTSSAARQRNPNPENPIPTNTPSPKEVTSISETNAVPVDSMGGQDASIQESVEAATKQLQRQAPNRDRPWAKGQQERSAAMTGPRFEQTMMEWQVCWNLVYLYFFRLLASRY